MAPGVASFVDRKAVLGNRLTFRGRFDATAQQFQPIRTRIGQRYVPTAGDKLPVEEGVRLAGDDTPLGHRIEHADQGAFPEIDGVVDGDFRIAVELHKAGEGYRLVEGDMRELLADLFAGIAIEPNVEALDEFEHAVAPDVAGTTIDGAEHRHVDFRGKIDTRFL